jgi:hypothetical protein
MVGVGVPALVLGGEPTAGATDPDTGVMVV